MRVVVQFVSVSFYRNLKGMSGLNVTDVRRERNPLLWNTVGKTVQCCFTSTETVRTIRDGEPGTATSTTTQLLKENSFGLRFLI